MHCFDITGFIPTIVYPVLVDTCVYLFSVLDTTMGNISPLFYLPVVFVLVYLVSVPDMEIRYIN